MNSTEIKEIFPNALLELRRLGYSVSYIPIKNKFLLNSKANRQTLKFEEMQIMEERYKPSRTGQLQGLQRGLNDDIK